MTIASLGDIRIVLGKAKGVCSEGVLVWRSGDIQGALLPLGG